MLNANISQQFTLTRPNSILYTNVRALRAGPLAIVAVQQDSVDATASVGPRTCNMTYRLLAYYELRRCDMVTKYDAYSSKGRTQVANALTKVLTSLERKNLRIKLDLA